MLFRLGTFVAALSLQTTFAAPTMENHVEDIQCRCLAFRTNERPTLCNLFEPRDFGWRSAQTLASQYDIKVQFASESTLSRVLSATTPLPSDVLQTTSYGDAQSESKEGNISQNKIVCGFGKEVRHMTQHYRHHEPESHFVGRVLGWLMLFIALYSSRDRTIKLNGEEKPLKASSNSNNDSS
ncbi:hypothetical protein ST47_g9158 [Ascochyta rabiei]|uniref:Uncharacterized protein n=1 Tax=Didymella rabiei TaxID=5454 RepID=A0A162Y165_DIDRA|nr:hypothetical protein ST47_g9158 [Ascochyta rabiei]